MDEEKNKIDVGQEVPVKENAVKKKVVRKKRTRTKTASEKTITRKKRPGRKKKTAGRKKTAKKRGRPRTVKSTRRRGAEKKTGLITLPINKDTDVAFWSRMVAFLNEKKNKSFVIHLDGKSFSLGTD